MVELEADDALASAAHLAALDERVEKVCIWTPDKDLAQCVVGERVVQVDRRSGQIRDEQGVHAKFGVMPALIPDYLALVGDTADGYPGIPRFGAKTAARADRAVRGHRAISRRGARASIAKTPCSSRTWRRCGKTSRSSTTSMRCAGRDLRRPSRWRLRRLAMRGC